MYGVMELMLCSNSARLGIIESWKHNLRWNGSKMWWSKLRDPSGDSSKLQISLKRVLELSWWISRISWYFLVLIAQGYGQLRLGTRILNKSFRVVIQTSNFVEAGVWNVMVNIKIVLVFLDISVDVEVFSK